MRLRTTLARAALALALVTTLGVSAVAAPVAEASPAGILRPDKDKNPSSGDGIGSIPIIGDLVGAQDTSNPVQMVSGGLRFAADATDVVGPIIVESFGR